MLDGCIISQRFCFACVSICISTEELLFAEAAEGRVGFTATNAEQHLKIGQFVSKEAELLVLHVPRGSGFRLTCNIAINLAGFKAIR